MELGAVSVLVELLLILVLVLVFTGRRRMKSRQDRLAGIAPLSSSPPSLAVPALVPLPPDPDEFSRVSEELLPTCFADTCADWAQVDVPVPGSMSCTIAPQAQHCV